LNKKAQKHEDYKATVIVDRIRFGDVKQDKGFEFCPDCGVNIGEFHVPLFDWEQCPLCGSYALSCDCELKCS